MYATTAREQARNLRHFRAMREIQANDVTTTIWPRKRENASAFSLFQSQIVLVTLFAWISHARVCATSEENLPVLKHFALSVALAFAFVYFDNDKIVYLSTFARGRLRGVSEASLRHFFLFDFNHLTAKLFSLNFHPLEVVSR